MDNKGINTKHRFQLSGALTWILLAVVVAVFIFGFRSTILINTPATSIRNFFESCFAGEYEKGWDLILDGSTYQDQKGNLETFTEMWERGKNHGTQYVGVRIDGVMWNLPAREAKVLFTLMMWTEQTREKVKGKPEEGLYKTKTLADSSVGSIFMKLDADGIWKLMESEF